MSQYPSHYEIDEDTIPYKIVKRDDFGTHKYRVWQYLADIGEHDFESFEEAVIWLNLRGWKIVRHYSGDAGTYENWETAKM